MNTELIARLRQAKATAEEDYYSACDPDLIGEAADALEAKPVDCRNCDTYTEHIGCDRELDDREQDCTNGDKFKPLEPIKLYKQE